MSYRPPQRIDEIRPGYYRLRHVKNGPWIAASIEIRGNLILLTQDATPPTAQCTANEYADMVISAVIEGEAFRHPIIRCVWFGVPIEAAEHAHMLREAAWARANAPRHPLANPDRPIDVSRIPIKDLF